jgi:hypothetical protein
LPQKPAFFIFFSKKETKEEIAEKCSVFCYQIKQESGKLYMQILLHT